MQYDPVKLRNFNIKQTKCGIWAQVEISEIATGIRRRLRSVPFISGRNFRRESFAASTSLN